MPRLLGRRILSFVHLTEHLPSAFIFGFSNNLNVTFVMQPTFRPSKLRRARKFGFRARNSTHAGRKVLAARRAKGRHRLAA